MTNSPSSNVHGHFSPRIERKLAAAKRALSAVFEDTSVDKAETAAALDEISYEISNMLETLRECGDE